MFSISKDQFGSIKNNTIQPGAHFTVPSKEVLPNPDGERIYDGFHINHSPLKPQDGVQARRGGQSRPSYGTWTVTRPARSRDEKEGMELRVRNEGGDVWRELPLRNCPGVEPGRGRRLPDVSYHILVEDVDFYGLAV